MIARKPKLATKDTEIASMAKQNRKNITLLTMNATKNSGLSTITVLKEKSNSAVIDIAKRDAGQHAKKHDKDD